MINSFIFYARSNAIINFGVMFYTGGRKFEKLVGCKYAMGIINILGVEYMGTSFESNDYECLLKLYCVEFSKHYIREGQTITPDIVYLDHTIMHYYNKDHEKAIYIIVYLFIKYIGAYEYNPSIFLMDYKIKQFEPIFIKPCYRYYISAFIKYLITQGDFICNIYNRISSKKGRKSSEGFTSIIIEFIIKFSKIFPEVIYGRRYCTDDEILKMLAAK